MNILILPIVSVVGWRGEKNETRDREIEIVFNIQKINTKIYFIKPSKNNCHILVVLCVTNYVKNIEDIMAPSNQQQCMYSSLLCMLVCDFGLNS